jgi:hypothetical protein
MKYCFLYNPPYSNVITQRPDLFITVEVKLNGPFIDIDLDPAETASLLNLDEAVKDIIDLSTKICRQVEGAMIINKAFKVSLFQSLINLLK